MSTAACGASAGWADGVGVVIVSDSPVQRRFLRAVIEADPELTLAGEARTGKEALALIERLRPAVVLIDFDLPVRNGIEAIEWIMATMPTPILVYSALGAGPDDADGLAALAAGAVDIVPKPGWPNAADDAGVGVGVDLSSYADDLRRRLRVASRVRVITHPRGKLRAAAASTGAAATSEPAPDAARQVSRQFSLIAMGVSTGGPQALAYLLGQLPERVDQAVLVVQHMADGFLDGLADWLGSQCSLPVAVGESGKRLQPGTVTIAPGGKNLIVHERLRVTCERPPPTQFHLPGIDPTFASIADSVGPDAIGVILTGMGRDGAAGLKAMRDRGAATIGQDEASCAVYGMPGAAMELGAVERELPLSQIPAALRVLIARVGSEE